jgi:multicomponent Na+:H+ antiporter subunit B
MPTTLVVGIDVVVHGHVTPGGGFQGGVVLATGLHLLYVAGRYRSMEKLRPMPLVETSEAAGTAAFAALGFAGLGVTGSFLADMVPMGSFGQLLSAGAVPLFNVAVGLAVASGCVVLLAKFFEQVFLVQKDGDS